MVTISILHFFSASLISFITKENDESLLCKMNNVF